MSSPILSSRRVTGNGTDRLDADLVRHGGTGKVDEADQRLQHCHLARGRTVAIDVGVGGLSEEALVDQLGAQQHQLLARRQGILADDARHPFDAGLFLEQLEQAPALQRPLRIALLAPELVQHLGVFGIGLQRMYRGVEACLRSRGIQRPEAAHITLGVRGDRLREIRRGRTDGTDDAERADIPVQGAHVRGTFIEIRQAAAQVGRIARLAGQFTQPPETTRAVPPPSGWWNRP